MGVGFRFYLLERTKETLIEVVQEDVSGDAAEGTEATPWTESAGERRRARSLGETGEDFIPHSISNPKRPRTDQELAPQGEGVHPAAFSLMRVRCAWLALRDAMAYLWHRLSYGSFSLA